MKIISYGTKQSPETRRPFLVEDAVAEYSETETVSSPQDVVDLMRICFYADMHTEEHLWLIAFDASGRVKGVFEVSHGTSTASLIDPAAIFMRALLVGANRIALVHNHPSGCCSPSNADVATTERIQQAGKLLNVPLTDHIIIGIGTWFSFMANGMLEE